MVVCIKAIPYRSNGTRFIEQAVSYKPSTNTAVVIGEHIVTVDLKVPALKGPPNFAEQHFTFCRQNVDRLVGRADSVELHLGRIGLVSHDQNFESGLAPSQLGDQKPEREGEKSAIRPRCHELFFDDDARVLPKFGRLYRHSVGSRR